ncbi:MAG: LEPR-XLL domain-containing protein [Planctomycetes bacterium]|nr:LEPR-XLL domain-containing protein [Planctomycetota bacterium]
MERLPRLEMLEPRLLLSADLAGVPDWIEAGPRPLIGAQVEIPPDYAAAGAVESIAVDPYDPTQIYLGTVNGGVWRGNNVDPDNPDDIVWTALTDMLPSLAIGSLAFSPLDPLGLTLFAGTGSFSSLSSSGGLAAGVYRTTDGGTTWDVFAVNPGNEPRIRTILPTAIDLNPGSEIDQVVLAGAIDGTGMFRSDDSGENWAFIGGLNGLPNGNISDLIVDPNDPLQFYAAVSNNGVYCGNFDTSDGSLDWTAVNTGMTGLAAAGNIQLAAHASGLDTVLFSLVSGVVGDTPNPSAYRSTDGGANWNALAKPPDMFSRDIVSRAANTMEADPTNDGVVYITTYSGGENIFRYDPSGSGSWVSICGSGAKDNTLPHADGRDLAFLGTDVLLDANDGGFYFIKNPLDAANNPWQDFIGNGVDGTALGDVEVHNIGWDSLFDVAVVGMQDNGTAVQNGSGNLVYDHFSGGDGGDVNIDTVTRAGQSVRYVSSQNLGGFRRVVFDSATHIVESVELIPAGGLAGFVGQFVNPVQISALDPAAGESKRIVIGGGTDATTPNGAVYLATNAATAADAGAVDWTQILVDGGSPGLGAVTTMALGGRRGGVDNQDVLYVGDNNGRVYLRSAAGGNLVAVATPAGGGDIVDIVMDPENWQHVFVMRGNRVFESTDAGTNWTEWTGNLSDPQLRSLEFVDVGEGVLFAGGNNGVYRMRLSDPGRWTKFGTGLPNALALDMDYDELDNVFAVGTLGRGAWTVANASDFANAPAVLIINGDTDFAGQDDVIKLFLDDTIPSLLHVVLNGVEQGPFAINILEQINVNGLGGNDTLIVDNTNGLVMVRNGIRYDGGSGSDLLQEIAPDGADATYDVGPALGAGVVTLDDGSTVSTLQFYNLEPVEIRGAGTGSSLTVNATDSVNAINYIEGPNSLDASHPVFLGDSTGYVSIDTFETVEFSNFEELMIHAGAGDDSIHLHNNTTPAALATLFAYGDDDTVGDTLIVNGVSATTSLDISTGTITGASGTGVSIRFATIEQLDVVAGASDTLAVSGSSDYTVNPGAAVDDGTVITGAMPINFFGFGAGDVLDLAGTGVLVINGTNANDTFTVSATSGAVVSSGRATVERSGSLTDLFLNGLDGDDEFHVTGAQPYAAIHLAGGDPSASDVAYLTGDGSAVIVNLGAATPSVTGGGLGTVDLTGVEWLDVDAANANLTVRSTGGSDRVEVSALGIDSGTVQANILAPVTSFANVAVLSIDLLGGDDTLVINASEGNDALAITGSSVAITGKQTLDYSNAEALIVNGLAGSDTFEVTPASIPIFVDGGNPIGVQPGDVLTVQAGGGTATVDTGPENDEGAVTIAANEPVSFDHIESLIIDGAGVAVIDGTNGPDAITIVARDDSTHAGADGVQDFTSAVNDGPELLWLNTATLTVSALGGSDEVVLRTPAPNNADWDVDVTIEGGPPSASDRLVVETPGNGAETVTYLPGADDGGAMTIVESDTALATGVTIIGIEELAYDGEADDDVLTVVGTGGNDITLHLPGADDESGQFQVNTLLALDYQNLGSGATLTSDGAGGTNSLTAYGTAVNDIFCLDATGEVGLNSRLVIHTENTQNLRLEGLSGDDLFDLLNSISDLPFGQILLNGGAQASAQGDRAKLRGTAGDDSFAVTGQTIVLGGVSIVGDGLEAIQLDGNGGADDLTYTGMDGVDDYVAIRISGTPNAGVLDVAGVALYSYVGIGRFEVYGNDGMLGDTDTLTVIGTNNDDIFDVNMDAAGDASEPVLEVSNRNGGLLMTLANYINLPTLNLEGREGGDVFNVWTGFDMSRQIFIDAGLPAGKTRQRPADKTDDLNVYYERARPNITHNTETQDPDSGIVDLQYDNGSRSLIQYLNIEDVTITYGEYTVDAGGGGSDGGSGWGPGGKPKL